MLLTKIPPMPPFYDSVQAYFDQHHTVQPTVADVRAAVVAIRTAKLPDVKTVANNGSFFGNPMVDEALFTQLLADNPQIKYWRTDKGEVKLSAAWLMEQAGFKDVHDAQTGIATWPKQTLVFVNEHAHSTADLLAFKQKVVDTVKQKFGVTLVQEPELLP